MKKIRIFLFVLLLSVIHVHLSINTQDNGLNPLTYFILIDSRTLCISENDAFLLGGNINSKSCDDTNCALFYEME